MAPAIKHSQSELPDILECYSFTLILSGFDEITSKIENALYEAGCNDALLVPQLVNVMSPGQETA